MKIIDKDNTHNTSITAFSAIYDVCAHRVNQGYHWLIESVKNVVIVSKNSDFFSTSSEVIKKRWQQSLENLTRDNVISHLRYILLILVLILAFINLKKLIQFFPKKQETHDNDPISPLKMILKGRLKKRSNNINYNELFEEPIDIKLNQHETKYENKANQNGLDHLFQLAKEKENFQLFIEQQSANNNLDIIKEEIVESVLDRDHSKNVDLIQFEEKQYSEELREEDLFKKKLPAFVEDNSYDNSNINNRIKNRDIFHQTPISRCITDLKNKIVNN